MDEKQWNHATANTFPLTVRSQHVIVPGTAQDGSFPHIGDQNECLKAHKNPSAKYVTAPALVDSDSKQWWLFDATPDMDKAAAILQIFHG